MQVAFVQIGKATEFSATYEGIVGTFTSSIQGNRYLDTREGSTAPYYSTDEQSVLSNNPSMSNPQKERELYDEDTPCVGPPMTSQHTPPDATTNLVNWMNVLLDFDIYVVAQTVETRCAANDVFTVRAKASWTFRGTGSVETTGPHKYEYTPGSGAMVIVPSTWDPITDGSEAPLTHGNQTLFTDALRTDTWAL